MPIYDYECRACGRTFEMRATFKQKEEGLHPVCPACESEQTAQVVSAPMVVRNTSGGAPALSACCPTGGSGCCSN